ncbi:MAG: serine acetyltransferase [Erysipelotrichaceae bacterium]|nr:serine acetyltransferase [Erysipelotrichaceae bacterium]
MNEYLLEDLDRIKDEDLRFAEFPDRESILSVLKATQALLFPAYFSYRDSGREELLAHIRSKLAQEINAAYTFVGANCPDCTENAVEAYLSKLPEVKRLLLTDIQAMYDGDPAARSKAEIILCYPGFYAILDYRIAHILYELDIPYIPRVMTEHAHSKTGIDIHPGAQIGEYFCIDHGTGIVIGETATIGKNVKLYQGVTIGAKSFEMDENGHPVKGGKRHPDLGDDVVVYANATILGGDTRVGKGSVIGANVWLIHSVDDDSRIYYREDL